MRHVIWAAIAAALVSTACGGGQTTSEEPAATDDVGMTTGGPLVEAEPVAEPEPEPEPEPVSGPGQLTVVNRVGGEDVGGNVQVLSSAGEVVAEGASGETFTLDSGTYRLVGEITDEDVLLDTPTRESDDLVTVVAGETQTASIDHPRSRVRIRVIRRGRPVSRWRMDIRRQGEPEAEQLQLRASEEHTAITPGRYDATLHVGNQEIQVNGIIFQGGATMDLPVNVD